jgi:hypothetical protein
MVVAAAPSCGAIAIVGCCGGGKSTLARRQGDRRLTSYSYTYNRGWMLKKLTITVDEDVYDGLRRKIGRRKISRFLNDLAKPLVTEDALLAGYRAMAADGVQECEAEEWAEGLIGDVVGNDD